MKMVEMVALHKHTPTAISLPSLLLSSDASTQDARRFATWLQSEHPGLKATEITPIDAKTYRDHLLAKRFAPTTINRALISLMLFFDTIDSTNRGPSMIRPENNAKDF